MGSDRLHLHAGIPAADFWSLALYDALSASGLDNGQRFRSFASFNKAEANADGSIDRYLGPTALAGAVEAHTVLAPALEGFAPTPEMPEIAEAQALLAGRRKPARSKRKPPGGSD